LDIIIALIIGVIAGWAAGMIVKGGGFGLLGDLIAGVLGAYLGGFVLDLVGMSAYGLIGYLISSIVGAVVLLALIRMVKSA
jgi:uncharacterized membrane protein YeaQ/YmgE (transglycosylase-associated protein family)